MGGDPKLEALVKSNARWCVISSLLAILAPLGLHALFERQAGRLEALGDHGRKVQATVLAIEQQGGKSYTEYGYVVDGRTYTWNVARADAPYPEGADFTVLYLPEDPSFSRPGADPAVPRGEATGNRRFTRKLLLGIFAFFVLNAVLCAVKLRRLRSQGMPVNGFLLSPEWTGRLLALLFLSILLGTNLTGNSPEFYRRAFGATPLGAPVLVVVSVVQAVLFVPYFWVWPHLMRIAFQAARDRASLSGANLMHYILVAPGRHPELRYSRTVALAGLGYFILLVGAWIAYTAYRGI